MIAYACPGCKTKLENIDANAGKKDRCPDCGLYHTVPYAKNPARAPQPFPSAEPMVSIADVAEAFETRQIPPTIKNTTLPKEEFSTGKSQILKALNGLAKKNPNIEKPTFAESILYIDGYICLTLSLFIFIFGIIAAIVTHEEKSLWISISISVGLFSTSIISFWMQDLLQYFRKLIFEIRELRTGCNESPPSV